MDEKGQALAWTLIILVVGVLILLPLLSFASATLISSRQHLEETRTRYSADAGVEDAIWRLKYSPGFTPTFAITNPTSYVITVNETTVNVTITRLTP